MTAEHISVPGCYEDLNDVLVAWSAELIYCESNIVLRKKECLS